MDFNKFSKSLDKYTWTKADNSSSSVIKNLNKSYRRNMVFRWKWQPSPGERKRMRSSEPRRRGFGQ